MPDFGRRVILKPPQLDARTAAQLERALSAAVEAQMALAAKSAHVLQLVGALQQNETEFFVAHEPATPLIRPAALFDASQPGSEAPALLRITAAIFDALKAVHGAGGALRVHGGLCPGVMLVSADGIEKISDFGFAQAICSVLGAERYLNLAVAVPPDADKSGMTAIWEALAAEEYERQDRICAFVDPEKYRTQSMTGFETGSDIIAAGFLLHLLAEREHPYLPDADAHRMVEMSQFMSMSRYNGSRRPDLRGSSDPAVKLWCDLVAQMLATLPQERPTAAAVSDALYVHVKPASAGDLVSRQFIARQDRLRNTPADKVDWHAERAAIAEIAGNSDLDAEIGAAAKKLLAECDARLAYSDLCAAIDAENLADARTQCDRLLTMPALPHEVMQQARDADVLVKRNAEALREIARLSQIRGELDTDPEAALAQIAALRNGVESLSGRGKLLASAHSKLTALQEAVARDEAKTKERIHEKVRADKERAEAERKQRAEDKASAEAWMQELDAALRDEKWDALPALLKGQPTLRFFPPEVQRRAEEVQKKLDAYLAEKKRQEAIRADHAKAATWIAEVRTSVASGKWDAAEKQLAKKPTLNHWPKEVLQEETALIAKVAEQRRAEREIAEAKAWFDKLRSAVKAQRWSEAGDVLAERSRLARVPEEIAADIPALEKEIKEHLQAIELEQRRRKEELRQAEEWFKKAEQLATAEEWDKAIAHLGEPPKLSEFPAAVRVQADALLKEVRARREAAQRQRADQRRAAAAEAVRIFVTESTGRLPGLLTAGSVAISANEVTFKDDQALDQGMAKFTLTVRAGDAPLPKSEWKGEIPFVVDAKGVRLTDDKNAVRDAITAHLKSIIAARQQQELARWTMEVRIGLLAAAKFDGPGAEKLPAKDVNSLLSIGEGKERIEVNAILVWRAAELTWGLNNEPELLKPIVEANARRAAGDVRAALVKSSAELKRYEAILEASITAGSVAGLAALQKGAPLNIAVSARIPGRKETAPLSNFTAISTTFGSATLGDLTGVEAALRKLIVDAQHGGWQALIDALHAEADAAGLKRHVKLAANPAKITQPVETIAVSVRVLKRAPVSLEAVWDPATFTLKRKGDWSAATKPLFAPLAPGEGKRGMAVPAGIAAAVVIAGGLSLWATRGPSSPPPVTPDAPVVDAQTKPEEQKPTEVAQTDPPAETNPQPQETTETPPVTPPVTPPTTLASCAEFKDAVVKEVRELIESGSAEIKNALSRGEWDPPSAQISGEQLLVAYTVPGLAAQAAPLTISPGVNGQCTLSAADRSAIEQSVAALDNLFILPATKSQLDAMLTAKSATALTPFLNQAQGVVELTPPELWVLESGVWEGFALLRLVVIDAAKNVVASSAESKIGVKIAAGADTLNAANEVEAEMNTLLQRAVLAVQSPAAKKVIDELTTQLRGEKLGASCTVTLAEPPGKTELTSPATSLALLVRCPDQNGLEKTLNAAWDQAGLQFTAPDIAGVLTELTPKGPEPAAAADYTAWVEAINAALPTQGPDWLKNFPTAKITAAAPPEGGTWKLRVSAPWAGDDPANAADDFLPLEIEDNGLTTKQDPSAVAARILNGPLQRFPLYWPVVELYANLKANKDSANNEVLDLLIPKATVLWKAPDETTPLQFALDRVADAPIKPNYDESGAPQSLTLAVQGFWVFADAEVEKRLSHVADALNDLMAADSAQWTVTINRAGKLEEVAWTGDASLRKAMSTAEEKIRWITVFLRRSATEARLAAAVGKPLSAPAALALLEEVWTAKQFQRGKESKALESLSADLFNARGRREGGPTIFAEFFCGLKDCYGIVWSAPKPPNTGVIDGPAVVNIGSLVTLRGASEAERAAKMLDGILDAVPRAVKADDFANQFGLLVALDRILLPMTPQALPEVQLATRTSALYTGGDLSSQDIVWSKLSDLKRSPQYFFNTTTTDVLNANQTRDFTEFNKLKEENNTEKNWAISQMSGNPATP